MSESKENITSHTGIQICANDLVIHIKGEVSDITQAYGKRISKTNMNPYINHARGKMEAYLDVLDIIKRLSNV